MVEVLSVCNSRSESDASSLQVAFIVMFASFLTIDIGLTAYSVWRGVNSAQPEG